MPTRPSHAAPAPFVLLVLLTACGSPWQRHDAYRLCPSVARDEPYAPALTCDAYMMCLNEARLTADERAALLRRGAAAGCPEP